GGLNILDFAFHDNGLRLRAHFQAAVQDRSLSDGYGYRRDLHRLEAAGFYSYAIISGREQAKMVNAVSRSHGRSRLAGIATRGGYRGIRNHGARGVLDRARQSSGAGRLGH